MYGLLSHVGKAFIVGGLLPAVLFALLNIVVFLEFEFRALPTSIGDGSLALFLAGVVLLGAVLLGLNTPIIKLYEGSTRVQRFVLRYFLNRNLSRHESLYKTLQIYKAEYESTADQVKKSSLAHAIESEWRRILPERGKHHIPLDRRRILPTRLGNIFAIIEEYPSVRYGMDGMVFWPRLLPVLPEKHATVIGHEKTNFDFLINLSLLSIVLAGEMLGTFAYNSWEPAFAFYGVGFAVLSYMLYRAATMNIIAMGELINSAFDLFRHDILRKMQLRVPATIEEERELWFRLSNYIASGESFYYPEREQRIEEAGGEQATVASGVR